MDVELQDTIEGLTEQAELKLRYLDRAEQAEDALREILKRIRSYKGLKDALVSDIEVLARRALR